MILMNNRKLAQEDSQLQNLVVEVKPRNLQILLMKENIKISFLSQHLSLFRLLQAALLNKSLSNTFLNQYLKPNKILRTFQDQIPSNMLLSFFLFKLQTILLNQIL